jgi:CheY-like chemotaxis protein
MSTNGTRHLRVLIADEDEDALHHLAAVLEQLGHEVTPGSYTHLTLPTI